MDDEMVTDPTLERQDAALRTRTELTYAATPRGLAAWQLASALDDAYYAHLRFRLQRDVFGLHGENYDDRRERVWADVNAFCDRTIALARTQAMKAGWSEGELRASGLDLTE
jgi:hypothetical protein